MHNFSVYHMWRDYIQSLYRYRAISSLADQMYDTGTVGTPICKVKVCNNYLCTDLCLFL
jgi:hypothetical protein